MTMPHIPDIKPTIEFTRHEAVTLLLSSIALEEIGISHILNAEGEKIQYVLKQNPSVHDLFRMNRFTERLLRKLIHQEMLLQEKLENVIEMCHRCDAEDSEEDCDLEE
jgi:hypothetical protein